MLSLKTPVKGMAFAAAAAFALTASSAYAQDAELPDCNIEVVIHSSYGGGTDVTARMMMIRSRRELERDMQVVAKRGGSGASAQNYVLSRPADGCTIMALTQTHLYTMARGQSDMKIDDITGVARAMDDPTFLVVSGNSGIKTMDDLIAKAKEAPLNFGVAQIGGTEHIGLAQLAEAAGIPHKVVPFGSGAQMVQALLSGAIDATLPNVSEAANQVGDGSFTAVAVLANERLDDYPDIPTAKELGYDVQTSTTRGYAVRAGTPEPIIEKLSAALTEAMNHEVFANYLASAGLKPSTSVAGWKVWDKQLKDEYAKSEKALRDLGLMNQ